MTKMYAVSAVLMALAFGLLALGIHRAITAAHSQPISACVTQKDYDRIRQLSVNAIDQAFGEQVVHLYAVWLKDFDPEPKRAVVGMANNISAYQRAMANSNAWRPVICK